MYSVVLMMAMSGGAEVPDFHRRRGHGCNGGYACSGCYGGGYGCSGCYGGVSYGCSGYSCAGGYGCQGGCYGSPYGGGCYSAPYRGGGYEKPPPPKGVEKMTPPKKVEESVQAPGRATLIVSMPAEARLLVDDRPTSISSERRMFVTPILEPGRSYYYVLRAEVNRDGQTYAETRRVTVRAGEESRISFSLASPEQTVASQQP